MDYSIGPNIILRIFTSRVLLCLILLDALLLWEVYFLRFKGLQWKGRHSMGLAIAVSINSINYMIDIAFPELSFIRSVFRATTTILFLFILVILMDITWHYHWKLFSSFSDSVRSYCS